ncbi:HGxxPAAW family protein [Actinacidiphila sp. ITFR-21]|uniref:HGxxPAAW family protein n=1 Tax=Actinacidiphila sp. ITFR-21 TaxID=3075199 RepID=UPI00288BFD89|nr:HGxxPAAW family protein [Streptomyces sp. ITFR-21]WNI15086.1 HGxxPAAW family protein [Streptomyces sp. ITFR-21]
MAATHDHGHTPAAWTGVIISFVGFCAAGAFMVAARPVGFWVSLGVILLGAVVGGVMKIMGFGAKMPRDIAAAHEKAAEAEAERDESRTPANAA